MTSLAVFEVFCEGKMALILKFILIKSLWFCLMQQLQWHTLALWKAWAARARIWNSPATAQKCHLQPPGERKHLSNFSCYLLKFVLELETKVGGYTLIQRLYAPEQTWELPEKAYMAKCSNFYYFLAIMARSCEWNLLFPEKQICNSEILLVKWLQWHRYTSSLHELSSSCCKWWWAVNLHTFHVWFPCLSHTDCFGYVSSCVCKQS